MSRYCRADRVLIIVSAAWLLALWLKPVWHERQSAFAATLLLIAVNAAVSFRALTQRRDVLIALNCVQIALFGVLNYQLAGAFGANHYRFDRDPHFVDWVEFTLSHVVRAADFLDALDECGYEIHNINHHSTTAGILLVTMHLAVDVFLVGLVLQWLRRYWSDPPRETYLERDRRTCAWLLATLAFYLGFGVFERFQASDWLLWPLENLLRLIDVGDMFQVFHWQLHGVEPTGCTRGGAIVFRVGAGIWMARLVIHVRLRLLRTWGVSVEQLLEHLDDPDAAVRRSAALGLGASGAAAIPALGALCDALRDIDLQVRCASAWALGQIGPPAEMAVPRLLDAAWVGEPELRTAAVDALGGIGPSARCAAYSLASLLRVSDPEQRQPIAYALAKIAPDIAWEQAIRPPMKKRRRPARPLKPPKRKPWQTALEAANVIQAQEPHIRELLVALVADGFFEEERDVEAIRAAVRKRVELVVLFNPLLDLTFEGVLWRRRSENGRWMYGSPRIVPRQR